MDPFRGPPPRSSATAASWALCVCFLFSKKKEDPPTQGYGSFVMSSFFSGSRKYQSRRNGTGAESDDKRNCAPILFFRDRSCRRGAVHLVQRDRAAIAQRASAHVSRHRAFFSLLFLYDAKKKRENTMEKKGGPCRDTAWRGHATKRGPLRIDKSRRAHPRLNRKWTRFRGSVRKEVYTKSSIFREEKGPTGARSSQTFFVARNDRVHNSAGMTANRTKTKTTGASFVPARRDGWQRHVHTRGGRPVGV